MLKVKLKLKILDIPEVRRQIPRCSRNKIVVIKRTSSIFNGVIMDLKTFDLMHYNYKYSFRQRFWAYNYIQWSLLLQKALKQKKNRLESSHYATKKNKKTNYNNSKYKSVNFGNTNAIFLVIFEIAIPFSKALLNIGVVRRARDTVYCNNVSERSHVLNSSTVSYWTILSELEQRKLVIGFNRMKLRVATITYFWGGASIGL